MKNKKALLIIDMQKGSFTSETPRFDTEGVVKRMNELSDLFRKSELPVIYIQHDGAGTGEFEKNTTEWELLDSLNVESTDILIDKYANDVFYKSVLQSKLKELNTTELLITGCATDFCVESTVQSALAKDYDITVVSDGHTTGERPHLTAEKVIEHYNWVWQNMIPTKGKIEVKTLEEIKNDTTKAIKHINKTILKHIKLILTIILLQAPLVFFGQVSLQSQLDSLNTIIHNPESDDTVRINTLIEKAELYESQLPDSTMTYLKSGLSIIEQTGIIEFKGNYLGYLGYLYLFKGDIKRALELYHKALSIDERILDRNFLYSSQKLTPKQVEYYIKSTANHLNSLGYLYDEQGDLESALDCYQKSLIKYQELGNLEGIAGAFNNIGGIHYTKQETGKAKEYFEKSLEIKINIGDVSGSVNTLCNLASLDESDGNYNSSLEYRQRCLKISRESSDLLLMSISLNELGGYYLAINQLDSAIQYAQKGLEIDKKLGYPSEIKKAAEILYKVLKKLDRPKEALVMYELHIQMRDSIKNEETQKATIRQQTKYEFEKAQLVKEQEEKEQARVLAEATSRRDNLQYSIVLIGLLVIGVLVTMLGRLSLPERVAEGLIFFAFLIFFEFILVLGDPYVESWTGGAPGLKLLINAGVAALIFPLHAFFETKLKRRLVKDRT